MEQDRKYVKVAKRDSGEILLDSVKWCKNRICRLMGYQFRREIKEGEGLILVHKSESIKGSSIHMLFVFTELTVIWLNNTGRVTSVQLAKPWRLYYTSPEPSSLVLETSPDLFDRISVGDELDFIDYL